MLRVLSIMVTKLPLATTTGARTSPLRMGWPARNPRRGVFPFRRLSSTMMLRRTSLAGILIEQIPSVVVDTESGFIKLGMIQPIAAAMGAQYLKLEDLRADNLAEAVRLKMPVIGEAPPHVD